MSSIAKKTIRILICTAVVVSVGIQIMRIFFTPEVRKRSDKQAIRHIEDISANAWGLLNNATIFFGHRSVGNNILEGIKDIMSSYDSIKIRLKETEVAEHIDTAVFAHAPVGRNTEPESKIAEFKRIMEGGLGQKVDIAFFKFCYADIMNHSNYKAIFTMYCETMQALKVHFPEVTFVHFTVPLCSPPNTMTGNLKAKIKRIIGKSTVLDDNLVRAQYNTLLRKRYSGKEPLFDLALYETIGPDGFQHYGFWKGQDVPVLVRSYTDDGCHLNIAGRRYMAEQLMIELLELSGSE